MTVTIQISDTIAQHLKNLALGQATDINQKLTTLLEAEYRRRLTRYNLVDRQLRQKYSMDFDQFEAQQITAKQNYTWDVESDAMAWETAIDGIETIQRRLADLLYVYN